MHSTCVKPRHLITLVVEKPNNVITQHFLVEHFLPYLLKNGAVYRKFTQVKARSAVAGESVASKTSDGLETTNTAAEGDYVVQNMTEIKEEYIVKPAAFHERYKPTHQKKDGWEIYDAQGKIVALEMNAVNLDSFGWQAPFWIEAPWKESMVVKQDDFLVSPLPGSDEVYRLARKEFFETYIIDE